MSKSTTVAQALYKALQQDLKNQLLSCTSLGDEIPTMDQRRVAIQMMQDKFLSKFVPDRDVALDTAACVSFLSGNERCKRWNVNELTSNESDLQLFGEFMKIVEDFFLVYLGEDCELTWGNIALNARSGPGAANGSSGNSHYEKFSAGPLTYSSPAVLTLFQTDAYLWPEFGCSETIRQLEFGEPQFIRGSKVSFVPKTSKTSRMIAVEPTLNVYYQLGLGEIISKRLKRYFGIDLSDQPDVNRYLAWLGSRVDATFGDGFATIDLTSASDCISLLMCSHVIPQEWLSALLALRSETTSVKLGDETFDVHLAMMSTMGNGFTFPLQTAIFACAAAACVAMDDQIRSSPTSWSMRRPGGLFSVFGDDIVIKASCCHRLRSFLTKLGFMPNQEKSFDSGEFRESCGHDYYRGHNVRPVFCRKLETEQDFAVIFNLLTDWSVRNAVHLPNALGFILDEAYKRFGGMFPVPLEEQEDAGARVPKALISRLGLPRDKTVQAVRYRCWVAQPKQLRFTESGFQKPDSGRKKRLLFNPPGLYWAYLRGEVRNHTLMLRDLEHTRGYRTKDRVTSRWDWRASERVDELTGTSIRFDVFARRAYVYLWGVVKRHHLKIRHKRVHKTRKGK